MGSKRARRRKPRSRTIECLEDRKVMSADPVGSLLGGAISHHALADQPIEHHGLLADIAVEQHALTDAVLQQHGGTAADGPALVHHSERDADFWLDSTAERDLDALLGDVEQTLASAHNSSGLTQVRNNYGFIGTGQTVAVIDSGIAFDHFALGGGFGANYRVVGGFDFTEEFDANPYDDGPAGSHGTHVAGIVGADRTGTADDGVAPGVDLVGLRIFNDAGDGYFSWVEEALQWVHQNRNAFENPITAVNMSIGTTWNSTSVPLWSTMEDELAQLKADGIFVTVSAGNDFASYNTPGLSYPAASPYVVPVMSADDGGSLSHFSQRHPRAIAAPGRFIVSTIPDYTGNNNGITDDFASYSGTSMAAPYVAGASVLLREAMQFVGYVNITQDTIFDHMMDTADSFFDAATSQTYKRLNLANAFSALMPTDEYGSTVATAYNLGSLSGTSAISGLVGTLTDADYFTFTAAATGTVSFTAATTHGLAPVWTASGGAVSGAQGETYTFDVVAGQSYTLGLSTSGGIGYYDLQIEAEAGFTYVDWGTITQVQTNNIVSTGEAWYRVQASLTGHFTAEAFFAAAGGNVDISLYNSSLQLLASGAATASGERVDLLASAGTDYFLRVVGVNADVDFRLTNLVSVSGSTLTVAGTTAADTLTFSVGALQHTVGVNGVSYQFDKSAINTINFSGDAGSDTITMTGSTGNETATLRSGSAQIVGTGFSMTATSVETQTFNGGGGVDDVIMFDTAGDDTFTAVPTYSTLTGAGYSIRTENVDSVTAYSNSAGPQTDRAFLHGSNGDDRYVGRTVYSMLEGQGFRNIAHGFDRVDAFAAGGTDLALIYDSAGDDRFVGRPEYAVIEGPSFYNVANGFDRVEVLAQLGGYDRAYLYDSAGDDMFVGRREYAYISGAGYYNITRGFDRVDGYAFAGGTDRAYLYDSAGDDRFVGRPEYSLLSGTGFYNLEWSFEKVYSFATGGGRDVAYMYDSAGNDRYIAGADYASMDGTGFYYYVQQYEDVYAYSGGQADLAIFYDTAGNDTFTSTPSGLTRGTNTINTAYSFRDYRITASAGGVDRLDLRGVVSADAFFGSGNLGTLTRAGSRIDGIGLDEIVLWKVPGAVPTVDVSAVDYLFSQVGG